MEEKNFNYDIDTLIALADRRPTPFAIILTPEFVDNNMTKLPFYLDKDFGLMLYGYQVMVTRDRSIPEPELNRPNWEEEYNELVYKRIKEALGVDINE